MANLQIKKHETPTHRYYTPWDATAFVTEIGRLRCITDAGHSFLQQSAAFCRMERATIARLIADKPVDKPALMVEFGFPGRMVNTATIHAKGCIDSARECAKLNLEDATEAIGRKLGEYWEASEATDGQAELFGRRRGLAKLVAREARAERAVVKPSVFPGRHAFLRQSELGPGWKADYEASRADHIGCIGSADEACGNSTLQVQLDEPEMREGNLWWWCTVAHAQQVLGYFRLRADENEDLLGILQTNATSKELAEVDAWLDDQGRIIHPKKVAQLQKEGRSPVATRKVLRTVTKGRTALNVMLHRHEDGRWYAHLSYGQTNFPKPFEPVGWMGVDLNVDSIAHACLSNDLVLLSYGKTYFKPDGPAGERTTELYKQINALVAEAKERRLGMSLEFLEFEASKRWLKNKLGVLLRMFPYRKIRAIFEDRCRAAGVPLRFVPSGYSSILGALIAQRHPELGRDQAACVIIAARATEDGNAWLEGLCETATKAESITLRFNAKGLFGCNTTLMGATSARPPHGHQRDHPCRPSSKYPSPLRWQICCGKRVSDISKTMRTDYRATVLAMRRAAVPQGRSNDIPRPQVPTLLINDHYAVLPRNAQL